MTSRLISVTAHTTDVKCVAIALHHSMVERLADNSRVHPYGRCFQSIPNLSAAYMMLWDISGVDHNNQTIAYLLSRDSSNTRYLSYLDSCHESPESHPKCRSVFWFVYGRRSWSARCSPSAIRLRSSPTLTLAAVMWSPKPNNSRQSESTPYVEHRYPPIGDPIIK